MKRRTVLKNYTREKAAMLEVTVLSIQVSKHRNKSLMLDARRKTSFIFCIWRWTICSVHTHSDVVCWSVRNKSYQKCTRKSSFVYKKKKWCWIEYGKLIQQCNTFLQSLKFLIKIVHSAAYILLLSCSNSIQKCYFQSIFHFPIGCQNDFPLQIACGVHHPPHPALTILVGILSHFASIKSDRILLNSLLRIIIEMSANNIYR